MELENSTENEMFVKNVRLQKVPIDTNAEILIKTEHLLHKKMYQALEKDIPINSNKMSVITFVLI